LARVGHGALLFEENGIVAPGRERVDQRVFSIPVGMRLLQPGVAAIFAVMSTIHRKTLLLLTMLTSCGSPEQAERRVTFACENGEQVEVRFLPTGVAILLRNGETKELKQQPAASGFRYSSGHFSVRGKGDELTIEVGTMAPLKCARAPATAPAA
jgi:membrane-bound inhibitor of C-type lysozyme